MRSGFNQAGGGGPPSAKPPRKRLFSRWEPRRPQLVLEPEQGGFEAGQIDRQFDATCLRFCLW
jgi:hypothetical protein